MTGRPVTDLVRPDIRTMRAYRSAEFYDGYVRLNANESPWRPPGDSTGPGLNRYPEPRPRALAASMAAHFGVPTRQVLVTRGSSEAIDVVMRAFCRAGQDEVVICPPTFGMYETYAQLQGARLRRIPLCRDRGYALDTGAILGQWADTTKVVFLCSPNNPTGNCIPTGEMRTIAAALNGRGIVVVDAAYAEFAGENPGGALLAEFDNVIVLRTLSKAMSLAGVRCGVLLAAPPLIDLFECVLPPYQFPTICAEAVQACLRTESAGEWARRLAILRSERDRLATALSRLPTVRKVWPSEANFLLVEAADAKSLLKTARDGGVLLRDFSWDRFLPGCVRITVGEPAENDQLLRALGAI